jgi:hypothetical protein
MKRQSTSGYILFEAVVSLAVLSVGVLAINTGMRDAIKLRGLAEDHTRVAFLMEQFMGEMEMQPVLPRESTRGVFPAPNDRFSYSWNVEAVELPVGEIRAGDLPVDTPTGWRLPAYEMGRLTLTVTWERQGEQYSQTVETLVPQQRLEPTELLDAEPPSGGIR